MNYHGAWDELVQTYGSIIDGKRRLQQDPGDSSQSFETALGMYKMKCFAERVCSDPRIAGPKLTTPDALRLHLINKHHWHLAYVRSIEQDEDFLFLLHAELTKMILTNEESAPIQRLRARN